MNILTAKNTNRILTLCLEEKTDYQATLEFCRKKSACRMDTGAPSAADDWLLTVAIANKTARTAWALLAKGEAYKAVAAI